MKPVSIGIAGIGNVGEEVVRQLLKSEDLNKKFVLGGISYKSKAKKRSSFLKKIKFYNSPLKLVKDNNIDLIIELIGGDSGIAKELAFSSITYKKPFITANKALIAKHGIELSNFSKKNNTFIGFEAAIAGGIPIVKVIKESLISNKIEQITGILNGTSNYLLDEIEKKSLNFETVLKKAQQLGYAEKDPTFDVEGIDAAHKISILSALVFNKMPDTDLMHVKGISKITLDDILFAKKFGYKIKLLAISNHKNNFECSVEPWMIPKNHSLSNIQGVLNAVEIISDLAGPILLTGAGAGGKATASSVLSDVFDFLSKTNRTGLTASNKKIKKSIKTTPYNQYLKFYLRVTVVDKSGVLADLTSIFKKNQISVQSFFQDIKPNEKNANLIIITHDVNRKKMEKAIYEINVLKNVVKDTICISIYE